jgi:hypothetical protein
MKQLLFVSILLGFGIQSYSQSEYQEGYVITLKSDTIKGLINVSNSNACVFKRSHEDQEQITYLPDDIQGYGYPNHFIASRQVSTKDGKEIRAFVDCLLKGDATLYQYQNSFYIEKTDTLFLALNKTATSGASAKSTDNARISTAGNYLGILSYLFMDCQEIRQKISTIKYTRSSLTSIVKDYNQCKSKDFVQYESGQPSIKVEIGLFSGVNFNALKMQTNDTNNDFLLSEPTYHSLSVVLGADARLSWPRSANKFALSAGAMYLSGNYEINETIHNSIGTDLYQGTIKTSELKIPLGVNYVLSNNKIKPYISGGFSMSFILQHSADFSRFHDDDYSEDYTDEYELFQFIPMVPPTAWFGMGTSTFLSAKSDVFLELRYETPSNISNSDNISTKYSHIFLLAGIRFK